MIKIYPNPNRDDYNAITKAVLDNDGYCPCKLVKDKDTKCMCKEFREMQELGVLCHCGRFFKLEDNK